jgi:hypothetical protein
MRLSTKQVTTITNTLQAQIDVDFDLRLYGSR